MANEKSASKEHLLPEKPVDSEKVEDCSSASKSLYNNLSSPSSCLYPNNHSSSLAEEVRHHAQLPCSKLYKRAVKLLSRYPACQDWEAITNAFRSRLMYPSSVSHRKKAAARSQNIDAWLVKDAKHRQNDCKALLMGLPRDVSHSLARQLQHLNGNRYSQQELQHYRREILDRTLLDVRHILQHMEDSGVQLEDCEDKRNALFVLEHSDSTNEWAPELAIAINKLWANAIVRKAMTDCSLHLHSTPYFFENLPRIAASNYAPTTTDILSIPTTCTTRNQYVIPIGPSDLYLIDTYSFLPRARRKQLFESPDAILFLVDISSYNRLLGDGTYTTDNALAASMCDLESVVRSLRGHQVAMLLLFHNVASFKEKLASDPLARYLPDYSGEDSVEKAVEYVAQRFRQLSRAGVAVHVQVLDLQDVASVRRVWDTLNESVLRPLPAIAAG